MKLGLVRNENDNVWRYFDDQNVSTVTDLNEHLDPSLQTKHAYLLFYKKNSNSTYCF
jgi:ubiquitin C-terminal hydrolase